MTDSGDLLNFLRNLCSHLAMGTALDMAEIRPALEAIKASLQGLYARYEEPAPEGAEVIREFMLEALELFYGSVEGIEAFLEEGDRERLAQSVVQAEEADDILGSIEYVIGQSQDLLSEFSVG